MKQFLLVGLLASTFAYADMQPKNEWNGVLPWQQPKDGFAVKNNPLGSGDPSRGKTEGLGASVPVADGLYHTPNSMPGFPTAATLWPRVQTIDCDQVGDKVVCDGYNINQAQGRGEYVYIQPNVKPAPQPPTVVVTPPTQEVVPPVTPPAKKKAPPKKRTPKKQPQLACPAK